MTRKIENIPASIKARLRNKAREINKPFGEILLYYGMERFLYRLSKTQYADNFILKGGLMFYGLDIPLRRPTRDIDFLGNKKTEKEDISHLFKDVLSISFPSDGIIFDINTITVADTQVGADHTGIRVAFVGYLGTSEIPMIIDIGFSDEIAFENLKIEYPVLFPEMGNLRLQGYPLESIISEKFHAMVKFADINSRLKDYFDIWLLSETCEFDCVRLQKALITTFENRATPIPFEQPVSLTNDFANKNQGNWKAFLERFKLKKIVTSDFRIIIDEIWVFLSCPLQISSYAENAVIKWLPGKGWT